MTMAAKPKTTSGKKPRSTPACAHCGGPVGKDRTHRPFCSARCKQLDLGKWLKEDYRIETEEPADPDTLEQMMNGGTIAPFPGRTFSRE